MKRVVEYWVQQCDSSGDWGSPQVFDRLMDAKKCFGRIRVTEEFPFSTLDMVVIEYDPDRDYCEKDGVTLRQIGKEPE